MAQPLESGHTTSTTIEAVVEAVSSGPVNGRRLRLRCDVRIDRISSLEISSVADSLGRTHREQVYAVARDARNNTFSTLEGMRFSWEATSLQSEGLEDAENPSLANASSANATGTHEVLSVIRLSDSDVIASKARQALEAHGTLADRVVLCGSRTGVASLALTILEPDYTEVPQTQRTFLVRDLTELHPAWRIRAAPATDIAYRVLLDIYGARKVATLPDEHFRFTAAEGTTAVTLVEARGGEGAALISASPLQLFGASSGAATALRPGRAAVGLVDTRLPAHLSSVGRVTIVEPRRLELVLDPFVPWRSPAGDLWSPLYDDSIPGLQEDKSRLACDISGDSDVDASGVPLLELLSALREDLSRGDMEWATDAEGVPLPRVLPHGSRPSFDYTWGRHSWAQRRRRDMGGFESARGASWSSRMEIREAADLNGAGVHLTHAVRAETYDDGCEGGSPVALMERWGFPWTQRSTRLEPVRQGESRPVPWRLIAGRGYWVTPELHEHLRGAVGTADAGSQLAPTSKSSEPLYAGHNVQFTMRIAGQDADAGAVLLVASEADAEEAARGADVDLLRYCRDGGAAEGKAQDVRARRRILVVACAAQAQATVSAALTGIGSDLHPEVTWPTKDGSGKDRRVEIRSPEVRAIVAQQLRISDPPQAVRIPFVPGIQQRLPIETEGGSGTTVVAVWRGPLMPRAATGSEKACTAAADGSEQDWLGMFNETRRLYHPDSLLPSSVDDSDDADDADGLAGQVRQAREVLHPGDGEVMSHETAGVAFAVASDSLDPYNADGQQITVAAPEIPKIAAGEVLEVMQGQAVWVGTRLLTGDELGFYACDASAVLLDWQIDGDSSLASIESPRQEAVLQQLIAFAGPLPVQGQQERLLHGAVCDWAALVGRRSGVATLEVSFDIARAGRPGAPRRRSQVPVLVYPSLKVLFAPAWAQLASSSSAVQAALEAQRGSGGESIAFVAADPDADLELGKVDGKLVGSVGMDHSRTYSSGRFSDVHGVSYGGEAGRMRLLGCSVPKLAQSLDAQALSASPRALNGTALFVDAAACRVAQGAVALPRVAVSTAEADPGVASGSTTLVIRDGPGAFLGSASSDLANASMAVEVSVCAMGDDGKCDASQSAEVDVTVLGASELGSIELGPRSSSSSGRYRAVRIACTPGGEDGDVQDAHAVVSLRLFTSMGTEAMDAETEDSLMDDAVRQASAEVVVRVHCLAVQGHSDSEVVPSLHLATHHATDAALEAVAVPAASGRGESRTVVAARGRKLFGVLDGWVRGDRRAGGKAESSSVQAPRWSRLLHVAFSSESPEELSTQLAQAEAGIGGSAAEVAMAIGGSNASTKAPWFGVMCGERAALRAGQVAGGSQGAVLVQSTDECSGSLGTLLLQGASGNASAVNRETLVSRAFAAGWWSNKLDWQRKHEPAYVFADSPGVRLTGPLARRAASGSRLAFVAAERLGEGALFGGWPGTRGEGTPVGAAGVRIRVVEGAKLLPEWALLADYGPLVRAGKRGTLLTRAIYRMARRHRADVPRALVYAGAGNAVRLSCRGGTSDVQYRLEDGVVLPQGLSLAGAAGGTAGGNGSEQAVVGLSLDASHSEEGTAQASTASVTALAEGDVTAICHDAGELRGVWGRRQEDHETRVSVSVRRLASLSIASRPTLPLNATSPVFVEALTAQGEAFDASQHDAMGLRLEVQEEAGEQHGLPVVQVLRSHRLPGGRGLYYYLRALRPGTATLQAFAAACRSTDPSQQCPEVRSTTIEVRVHMPLSLAPTAAGLVPGASFAMRATGGPPQMRSMRGKPGAFNFLAASSRPDIVVVQPWRGFAGGMAGGATGKSAAVYVAGRALGSSVVTAECVTRSSHARRLEPQHAVEAALGSGALFPRDTVVDFAVASLRVALPTSIAVDASREQSPEGTSVRVSIRGREGHSPLSLVGAPFAVSWRVDSPDGSAKIVPGGATASWSPSPLLGGDCARAEELGLALPSGFDASGANSGGAVWQIRDASRTVYLDVPGKSRITAELRLFNYSDACSSMLYRAGAAQSGGNAAIVEATGDATAANTPGKNAVGLAALHASLRNTCDGSDECHDVPSTYNASVSVTAVPRLSLLYPSLPVAAEACLSQDRSRVALGHPTDSPDYERYVPDDFDADGSAGASSGDGHRQLSTPAHSSSSRPILLPPTAGVRLLTTTPSGAASEPLCHVLPGSVGGDAALVNAGMPRDLKKRVPCSALDLQASALPGRSVLVMEDEGTNQVATAVFEVAPVAQLAICGPPSAVTFSATRYSLALVDGVGRVFASGRGVDCLPAGGHAAAGEPQNEFIRSTILSGEAASREEGGRGSEQFLHCQRSLLEPSASARATGLEGAGAGATQQEVERFADLSRLQVISTDPRVSIVAQNRDVVSVTFSKRDTRVQLAAWAPLAPVLPLPASASAEVGVLEGVTEGTCSSSTCPELAERMGDLPRVGFPPAVPTGSRRGGEGEHVEDPFIDAVRSNPEAAAAVRTAAIRLPRPALQDWTEVSSRSVLLTPGEITMTVGSTARIRVDPGAQDFVSLPAAYRGDEPWSITDETGEGVVAPQLATHCDLRAGQGPLLQLEATSPGVTVVQFMGCGPAAGQAASEVRVTVVAADALSLSMQEELAGSVITDGELPVVATLDESGSGEEAGLEGDRNEDPFGSQASGLAEALMTDRNAAFDSMAPARLYVLGASLLVDGQDVAPVDPTSTTELQQQRGPSTTFAWHGLNVSCTAGFEYAGAVAASERRLYDGDVLAFPWDGIRAFQPVRGSGSTHSRRAEKVDAGTAGFNKTELESLATRRLGSSPGCIVFVRRPRPAQSSARAVGVPPADGSIPSTIVVQMAAVQRKGGERSKVITSPRLAVPFQPAMRFVAADAPPKTNPTADTVATEFFRSDGWRADLEAASSPMAGTAGGGGGVSGPAGVNATTGTQSTPPGAASGSRRSRAGSVGEVPELWAQVGVFLSGTGGRPPVLCGRSGAPEEGAESCVVVRAAGFGWAATGGVAEAAGSDGYSRVAANSTALSLQPEAAGAGPWDLIEVVTEPGMTPVRRFVKQLSAVSRAGGLHPDDSVLSGSPDHAKVRLQRAAKGQPLASVLPTVLVEARVRGSLAARGNIADAICDQLTRASATLAGKVLGATEGELAFCEARNSGYNADDDQRLPALLLGIESVRVTSAASGGLREEVVDRGVVRVGLDVAVEPLQVTSWSRVVVYTALLVFVAIAAVSGASAMAYGDQGRPQARQRAGSGQRQVQGRARRGAR